MKKLNVLAIGMGWPSHQPGGLNTYFRSICIELSRYNSVSCLIYGDYDKNDINTNLKIYSINTEGGSIFKRQKQFLSYFKDIIKEKKIDLINVHFSPYALEITKFAKKMDIPIVMNFHGPWAQEILVENQSIKGKIKNLIAKSIETKVYKNANSFIVLSNFFKEVLIKDYTINQDKISIIPGAADINKFKPANNTHQLKSDLNIPFDRPIILTVRRLVRRMGLTNLVEAMAEVIKVHPNILLLIGGKGPLNNELKDLIKRYKLENNVRLLGYIQDDLLPKYHQISDLFVVPTQELEGFGLITIEAMASGLPVIATPVGGSKEILEKFDSKYLFESKNTKDLAKGIIEFFNNDTLLKDKSYYRNYILDNYTWEKVALQVSEQFLKVLRNKEEVTK
ncbi:glycosyltransferase family 4 protein [Metabacillus litoralis]|uniref:glycosyltransferase family 4 protein n=1 Tax=Metabacillus litoralis TaxID=152268 RepID=UPI00204235C3|nr:glycosyltransferase family 4 protein [Metabacillus litoralis]MCM3409929.1 glycosyltransferase family 4 protein [Metabacillus litoralis]